jgi:hypothetical protein
VHPNAFLKTYWRMELLPQVFVAMPFSDLHNARFHGVIEPAIGRLHVSGNPLKAFRVDNSKSGDSILTDIVDGVAHSQLVLADVSVIYRDPEAARAYRNANVLYEVGVALACRRPEEVLLIRDDRDERFLFDVSTIPHVTIDFDNQSTAVDVLHNALLDRLQSQQYSLDARIVIAVAGLTNGELSLLSELLFDAKGMARGWNPGGSVLSVHEHASSRLLEKGIIEVAGVFEERFFGYVLTPLGRRVAELAQSRPQLKAAPPTA